MKGSFGLLNSGYIWLKWWRTWRTLPVLSWVRAAGLYRAGKFDRAEKFYLMGIESHPNHPAHLCARLDLAYCHFRTGKLEEAEKQLKFVVTRMKNAREAYIRLAKLQLWGGRSLEAAWTLRRACREFVGDEELISNLIIACIDHGGPAHLVSEGERLAAALPESARTSARLRASLARLRVTRGERQEGRAELESLCMDQNAGLEALLLFSETLLEDGHVAHARLELRRALCLEANHPRVLSLLAEAYLRSGDHYSPEYSKQLATSACQNSGWLSAREMHILAEAYYHCGDNASALIIAEKAKRIGTKLLGEYRHVKNLERLIDALGATSTLHLKSRVL